MQPCPHMPLPPARSSPALQEPQLNHVAVKEAVLPFDKFAGADTLLGPEMRSTGEVRRGRRGLRSGWRHTFPTCLRACRLLLPCSGVGPNPTYLRTTTHTHTLAGHGH